MKREFLLIVAAGRIQLDRSVAGIKYEARQFQPRHVYGVVHVKRHGTRRAVYVHAGCHRPVFRGAQALHHDLADRTLHQRVGYIVLDTRGQSQ